MKKDYASPEFDLIKINLNSVIMAGDSNPEIIKEDGEIIDGNW